MANINFNKHEGETLRHDEWNALGDEFDRLERKIEDSKGAKIEFPEDGDSTKFLNGTGKFSVPTLKPITVNSEVTVVEDPQDAKVEATETEEGITLSFSLPKGETGNTGKVYVPTIDEESGDLSWSLQNNPQEEIDSTNIKGPQGERGVGLDVTTNKDGKQTTVVITTDEPNPSTLETIHINDGNDGHNPCLGRFASYPSTLPTVDANGNHVKNGDFFYVDTVEENTTITKMYRYLNDTWETSANGITLPSNVEDITFLTSQKVTETSIVDDLTTGGDANVLSAEAGKELNEKLYGVITRNETSTSTPTGTIRGSLSGVKTGTEFWAGDAITVNCRTSVKVDVQDYDEIRITANNTMKCYYAFTKKELPVTKINNVDTAVPTSFDDLVAGEYIDGTEYPTYNLINRNINVGETKTVDIPKGSKYIYFVYHSLSSTTDDYRPSTVVRIKKIVTGGDIPQIDENMQDYMTQINGIEENVEAVKEVACGKKEDIVEGMVQYSGMSIKSNEIVMDTSSTALKVCHKTLDKGSTLIEIEANEHDNAYLIITNGTTFYSNNSPYSRETFLNDYAATCHEAKSETDLRIVVPAGTKKSIALTDDAKKIYCQRRWSTSSDNSWCNENNSDDRYTPAHIYVYKKETEDIDEKFEKINVGSPVALKVGHYDDTGVYENNTKYATTGYIQLKGYYIELHEDYKFARASMFNDKYELVTLKAAQWVSSIGEFWGLVTPLPQYYVRLAIVRKDGEDIDITDNIIKRFIYLDDASLAKEKITNSSFDVKTFRAKQNILSKPIWTALEKVGISSNGGYSTNSHYFLKGSVNRGIPYSESAEYSKYVGQNISIVTFLTALMNKRSVMYTENVSSVQNKSSYGLVHNCLANLASTYYGTVCTGLTSYLLDMPSIVTSAGQRGSFGGKPIFKGRNYEWYVDGSTNKWREYSDANKTYYVTDANGNFEQSAKPVEDALDWLVEHIQTGDVIQRDGHCLIVGDIYNDKETGERKFICLQEQTKPRVKYISYPVDRFKARIKTTNSHQTNNTINGSNSVYFDVLVKRRQINSNYSDRHIFEKDLEFIQQFAEDYNPKLLKVDPDITTFAGEYASFTALADDGTYNYPYTINGVSKTLYNNNKAFLNIHRGGNAGYTHLQIFNEEDDVTTATPVEYSLADGSAWISDSVKSGGSLIYAKDAADQEDWIIFDLKKITNLLNTGMYKARVVRKNDNSIVKESGFSHWEMIYLSLSFTATNNNLSTIKYSATGGTPWMIRPEGLNGLGSNNGQVYIELSDAYTEGEEVTLSGNAIPNGVNDAFTSTSEFGNLALKLFVRGRYNDVVLRKVFNVESADEEGDDGNEDNQPSSEE